MSIKQSASIQQNHRHRILRYLIIILLSFIVIAGVVIYINFNSDINTANARINSIKTEIYTSQYGHIEYRIEGDGPAVIVLHGVTGGIDQGMYFANIYGFSGKGYKLLYISRFGYLKSDIPEDASAKKQAASYKALLNHLGVNRAFVYANSAGGTSAMWFAIEYPELTSGLILQSSAVPGPLIPAPPQMLSKSDFLYWAVVKTVPDMLIGILLPDEIRSTLTDKEKASLITNAFMAGLPISKRSNGIIFDNEISTPSVNEVPFERIKIPTLILQATDDPHEKEGAIELTKRIPNHQFIGLAGGHFLLRQEQKVETEILRFLANHTE